MQDGATEGGVKWTRSPDEDRGMFGRGEMMAEARQKFEQAKQEGQQKDGEAIHNATESGVEKVKKAVEAVGSGVETAVKFGDRLYRGAEATVKKTVENSWEVAKGLYEDTIDVAVGSARIVGTGIKYTIGGAIIAAAVPIATAVVTAEHAAVGLVELGQRGAKGLAELRRGAMGLMATGARSLASALEARDLVAQTRVENVRDQHQQRLASIQSAYLGPKVMEIGKQAIQEYYKK